MPSEESAPQESIEPLLMNLVNSDPQKFMFFFKLFRDRFPSEATRACAAIMGLNEATPPIQHIRAWSNYEKYFDLLLDPDFLSFDQAKRAAGVLRENDQRFFAKFTLYADRVKGRSATGLLRALDLLEAAGDYGVLFSWLRNLINHENENVRSKAVKLMCKVSPSRSVVERQLKSEDSRVRANAVEALWFSQDPDRTDVFRNALLDKAHRVVVNAAIGLYYQDQENAMAKLLKLSEHASEGFRAAAIWGFGFLMDVRAIPALEALQNDGSEAIRERAGKALASLLEKQKQVCAA
jgi:HEAT repeats